MAFNKKLIKMSKTNDNNKTNGGFLLILSFALTICFFEACAQNSLKQSRMNNSKNKYYLGIIFYIFVGYYLHMAYHNVGLGEMNLIWSCLSIIVALTVGYILYDEPINNYIILSILFALTAIYTAYLGYKQQ